MNTTCDIWTLLVDSHEDLTSLVAQALAVHTREIINERVEANLGNDASHNFFVVKLGLRRDLARDHHHVVLSHSLASNLALWVSGEASIKHSIRHLIAKFVRVTFIDGLRREKEHTACSRLLL